MGVWSIIPFKEEKEQEEGQRGRQAVDDVQDELFLISEAIQRLREPGIL